MYYSYSHYYYYFMSCYMSISCKDLRDLSDLTKAVILLQSQLEIYVDLCFFFFF